MERKGKVFISLSFHILFSPFFPMGKNGKTHIFPWAKNGVGPPQKYTFQNMCSNSCLYNWHKNTIFHSLNHVHDKIYLNNTHYTNNVRTHILRLNHISKNALKLCSI